MSSAPFSITCAFVLGAVVGAVVGALFGRARHRRMIVKKRRRTLPVSSDDVSANEDAKPHWGMKALW
jgi:hypothetical protein